MENLSDKILNLLKEKDAISSKDINVDVKDLHPAVLSLKTKNMCDFTISEYVYYEISKEGEEILNYGSHEFRLFESIGNDGIDISEADKNPLGKINAFKNRWIIKKGDKIYKNTDSVTDTIRLALKKVSECNELICKEDYHDENLYKSLTGKELDFLKKRKLISQIKKLVYHITRGPEFFLEKNLVSELTSKLVIDGSYKNSLFKPFNFNTKGVLGSFGALHPLMKIKEEIKKIFLEMGFTEMNTRQFVESSFWNFDVLFQPQQHPSRDVQDTFFMKNPKTSEPFNRNYMNIIKETHTSGKFGSDGHFHNWDIEEAKKNILRSHTTSVSAKYLYNLAKEGNPEIKLFSIDKVFRNETLDSTHLAEFHQVEGVIAGKGLTIGNLMDVFQQFFNKLGIKNVKFKPAFNPYTEPSMEVFGYHEGLKKWIEVGNSGMFRPEMLRPMGFDESYRVIGYGLSLERPAMIRYNINNIRDLVGHKVDFDFIKKSEFAYF